MGKQRKNTRRNRGITLIALVITIIILLILAGISIAELTGTGIFAKAKEAKAKYKNAEDLENQILADYESQLNSLGKSTVGSGDGGGGEQHDEPIPSGPNEQPATSIEEAKKEDMFEKTVNSTVTDEYGNQVVVPAGFKITDDASKVTEGIVIIDQQENEFVWIPVGEVKTKDQTKTIELSRYEFDNSGNPTKKGDEIIVCSIYNFQELATSDKGNAVAKNLEEFKTSVNQNHGYYIGRYEVRNYNYVKATGLVEAATVQTEASTVCQNMYNNDRFKSDLMNSYAWDTTIVFLQEFDDREDKSIPYSKITGELQKFSAEGTNNADIKDKICNVYDMGGNLYEWTTETGTWSYNPKYCCTFRGAAAGNSSRTVDKREAIEVEQKSNTLIGFRPILYFST